MIKKESIELFIERFEQLDNQSVKNYISRLARQSIFFEDIINHSILDGVIVLNSNLEIEFVNKKAYELIGLPINIIGKKAQRFFKEINWDVVTNQLEGIVKFSRQEIEIFYPKHRFLDLYISCSGKEKEITFIFHDNTDEREKSKISFEEEKVNALAMLAGGVAHELGNPLNSLNIHLQLLRRFCQKIPIPEKSEANEILNIAVQEINRLDVIVKQFLSAIRNTSPELIPQNVKKLLEESLDFLKPELNNKKIIIKTKWDKNIPFIKGDASQLKQAFYNIIKNSSQVMMDGGELVISIENEIDFLKITFADSGGGIASERLSKIFNCYQTDKNNGTGLGLFIVSRVIREHNGRIDISTNEYGTIFSLWFPLKERRQRLLETVTKI